MCLPASWGSYEGLTQVSKFNVWISRLSLVRVLTRASFYTEFSLRTGPSLHHETHFAGKDSCRQDARLLLEPPNTKSFFTIRKQTRLYLQTNVTHCSHNLHKIKCQHNEYQKRPVLKLSKLFSDGLYFFSSGLGGSGLLNGTRLLR